MAYASCFPRRPLQRLLTDGHVSGFSRSMISTSDCRWFSSPPPPPRRGNGAGGGGAGGSGAGGDGGSYRLRRPEIRSNQGPGGGSSGSGPSFRDKDGGAFKKRVNIYTNTTPYVSGSKGTRANAITLFPGNFMDEDDAFDDHDDDETFGAESVEDPDEVQYREFLQEQEKQAEALRLRRIELNKPIDRVSEIDERGRSYGRGGRKTAEARVWIQPGFGEIVINHKTLTDYFDRLTDREHVLAPFVATETCGAFDMQVMVKGGGLTGQAGAIRHGLARALNAYNPDLYRPALKLLGYLTRDPRKVERKKVGHVKARKSPQWVRR